MWKYIPNTELYHHGVKGQKWGVRKKVQTGTRKSSGTFQPNNTSNNSSGSDDVAQRRAKQGKKQYRKDVQEYRKQQRVRKALVITAGVAITAATAYATYKHFNKSPELNAMLSQKTKVSDIPKLNLGAKKKLNSLFSVGTDKTLNYPTTGNKRSESVLYSPVKKTKSIDKTLKYPSTSDITTKTLSYPSASDVADVAKKGYVTKKQYTNPDGTTNWNAMALDGLKELEKLANTGTL